MQNPAVHTLQRPHRWGISPTLRVTTHLLLLGAMLGGLAGGARAAYTEPRFALTRLTSYTSSTGRFTVKLEGTFSFADALQLGMPLNVFVTQGSVSARLELNGNVFLSLAGAPEQPTAGPGVVAVAQRELTVVLPAEFVAGNAQVRVVASYDNQQIASNQLSVTL